MPQPIDMQSELARTVIAERVQAITDRASMAASMRARLDEEDTQSTSQSTVGETPEMQNEHVNEDGRRKNPFVKRRKRKVSKSGSGEAKTFYNAHECAEESVDPANHDFDVSV